MHYLLGFLLSIAALSAEPVAVLVDQAPSMNGGTIDGDIWMLSGQGGNVNSGFTLDGDWRFPGTPNFNFNGTPNYDGIEEGEGSASPSGYWWTINSEVSLGALLTQIDPVPLLPTSAVQSPSGNRTVHLNSASDSPGDFSTCAT